MKSNLIAKCHSDWIPSCLNVQDDQILNEFHSEVPLVCPLAIYLVIHAQFSRAGFWYNA